MNIRKAAVALAALAVAAATITPIALSPAIAAPSSTAFHQTAHRIGSAHISAGATSAGEVRPAAGEDAAASTKRVANGSPKSRKPVPPPSLSGITGTSLSVQNGTSNVAFAGMNHRDQRLADGGNQWSLTPPDQGLCVGNGEVVELVNVAIRVFDTSGTPLTDTIALNPFFGFSHEVDRTVNPPVASDHQVGDPSCVYDAGTNRFFMAVYDYKADAAGNVLGPTYVDYAVSPAGTAIGTWQVFQIDVTNDGTDNTPSHPNCPCLGDYPHIGTDATGFYVTTNEYAWFTAEEQYNGANIYAMSKAKVIAGGDAVPVTTINTKRAANGEDGFTLAPALSVGTSYAVNAGGTMYFLSSDAAEEVHDHVYTPSTHILLWSLTNTSSLDSSSPAIALHHAFIDTNTYDLPPKSNQKVGSVPLADCLNWTACSKAVLGTPDKFKEYEFPIDSSDTRMLQAAYSGGQVWGALDTAVDVNGVKKAGIAYYVVDPTSTSTAVSGTLAKQQTIAVPNNNITFPALGVTSAGKAVMAVTLVGADYFPSAAYIKIDTTNGAGPVNIVGAGLGPDDDFSGYRGFEYNIPRWGDYGAAQVVGGTVWIASEYIGQTCTLSEYVASPLGSCGGTRTALANWGTFISSVTP
ncbi:MAG: hypothetical protein ACXVEX_11480 [Actinomycetota bacterium]